jgi:hypothetical protein
MRLNHLPRLVLGIAVQSGLIVSEEEEHATTLAQPNEERIAMAYVQAEQDRLALALAQVKRSWMEPTARIFVIILQYNCYNVTLLL